MKSLLHVYMETLDQHRVKLHYNQHSNVVQAKFLEELEKLYLQNLQKRNRQKLEEIGNLARTELLPNELDLSNFVNIINSTDFPIEMIWFDKGPLGSIIPIIYNASISNFENKVIAITNSNIKSLSNIAELYLNPKSILQFKQHVNNFQGWLHIDGHKQGEYIQLDKIKLFQEDLPHCILFLNGCNTVEMSTGKSGIYQRSKIKDATAEKFAKIFYDNLTSGLDAATSNCTATNELWEEDISVIGYIWKGNQDFILNQTVQNKELPYYFKDPNSKLVEKFSLKKRPDFGSFYSKEELITWNSKPMTRIELFSGQYSSDQVKINFVKDSYSLPPLLSVFRDGLLDYKRYTHKRIYGTAPRIWNDEIIKLYDLKLDNSIELWLNPAEFEEVMVTNLSPEVYIDSIDQTIREKYCPGSKLLEFSNSKLVNQVGVGSLLFTEDNFLILQKRSKKTLLTHKSQLGITNSIAGYVKNQKSYYLGGKPDIFQAVRAQAKEELSIEFDQIEGLTLIGCSRSLETCGSPSFRFFGKIKLTLEEFKEQWIQNHPEHHWEYNDFFVKLFPTNKQEIIDKLREIDMKYQDQIPSSTRVTFYFYEKFLKS